MTISFTRPGLAVAAIALVAACGSSGGGAGSGATAPSSAPTSAMPSMDMSPGAAATTTGGTDDAAGKATIHIKDFAFSAPSSPLHAGESFIVINDDSVPHTYETVTKGIFDSGTIDPGAQKELTAPAAGTYDIKCDFHPSMHGTLTVT